MSNATTHESPITDQIVESSVISDPAVPPTIPLGMTIADYRRARANDGRQRRFHRTRWVLRAAMDVGLAELISSAL